MKTINQYRKMSRGHRHAFQKRNRMTSNIAEDKNLTN